MTGMDFIRVLALVWLRPPIMASEPHPTRRLLARRLRVLRATHGWSQETLAASSLVAYACCAPRMAGRRKPSPPFWACTAPTSAVSNARSGRSRAYMRFGRSRRPRARDAQGCASVAGGRMPEATGITTSLYGTALVHPIHRGEA